ncbi:uncharacterized protein LOC121271015 [Carcharodon carcharias]|uniref:uncharacterized protein LOC121271015 n=1 Tax=Carcharodon carcharias TaxID=13397 RepID=UPI001B7E6504|nr:uncharacterized protein LOC121271015 [Carcharodon carcharias]
MEGARLITLVACSLMLPAETRPFSVLVRKGEVNATVGDAVTLSVKPSSPISSGFWRFGAQSIVIWTVEHPFLNVAYTKRNVLLLDNTSLLMGSVSLADSGEYWVTMDSPRGEEATAKVTLNVFPKPAPFTIAIKQKEIKTTAGNTVILSASPSQEVKNGSWRFGGKDVVWWRDTLSEVNADYSGRAAVLAETSLQLKSVAASDTGEYSVTMSTASGVTRSEKIYLNVLTMPQHVSVSPVLSQIKAEVGATVLLAVTISGEVKNGSWSTKGKLLFQWNSLIRNITEHREYSIDLLPNASLLLLYVHEFGFKEFTITLESPSGNRTAASITLEVFKPSHSCAVYSVGLAISTLLTLICILVIANHLRRKRQRDWYETHDLLTVFCKGYRVCVTLTMMAALNFTIIFAILINKHWCIQGHQPALDFFAN